MWLELPSFVTLGYPRPSALIVLKVKTSDYSEYPLHQIRSPPTLGYWGDSKAYLESESFMTKPYTVIEALIHLGIDLSFVTRKQPTGSY